MIASTLVVDHDKPLSKLFAPTVTRSLLLGSTLINQIFLINQGDSLCYHLWGDCDGRILFFCIEDSYFSLDTLMWVCLDCTFFLTKVQWAISLVFHHDTFTFPPQFFPNFFCVNSLPLVAVTFPSSSWGNSGTGKVLARGRCYQSFT